MLLSNREKILLTELLNSPEPVSTNRMMNLLKVSKRTMYRELENLEVSIQSFGGQLKRVSPGEFEIEANEQTIQAMQSRLKSKEQQELSTVERQHAILIELLLTTKNLSLNYFLDKYLISNTTFYADIKQIEFLLEVGSLTISRNKGYEIKGLEKDKRLLIANILGIEVNEYHFFHIAEVKEKDNFFLQFVNKDHLLFAQKIIQEELEHEMPNLSDRKLMYLMLVLTLTMDRVSAGIFLENETYTGQLNKELLNTSKQLFSKMAKETSELYSINEIVFFSELLSNFSNSFDDDFFDDDFDTQLAFQVKELIKQVSQSTGIKFYEDTNLYRMLLTHLSSVFFKAVLREDVLTNPILEQILGQYPDVARGIKLAVYDVFEAKELSEEEIAYIVIHFANSLEHATKVTEIDIAGFSPSGLASTSMLETRLRRHFPYINHIDFYRIADIDQLHLKERYDLVISTSALSGYNGKYKLVSPLLTEEEIKELKVEFKKITPRKKEYNDKELVESTDNYKRVLSLMNEIEGILRHFFVKSLHNPSEVSKTLELALSHIPREIILEKYEIYQKLMDRYEQTPIGIPNGEMALFHTASKEVLAPIFCLFDLENPLMIEGMDKKPMSLKRMLVMLAPMSIDESVVRLLGKISGAIIMNDLNMEIFHSGNEAIIYQLLASLLMEEIKEME